MNLVIKGIFIKILLISSRILYGTLNVTAQETITYELQEDIPAINCVFVGCSCQGKEDTVILLDSSELPDEPSPDILLAKDVIYDVFCHDNENPSFKFKSFPLRDNSKIYSHQISTLYLATNEITQIPALRLANLEITVAIFSENLISNVSEDAFKNVIKLDSLDLSVNKLADLSENVFVPLQDTLAHLKLNENTLGKMLPEKLEKCLSVLKHLRTLHLRSNYLKQLPDLSRLDQLDDLSLQSNQIDTLLNILPASLVDLNVNGNRIKQLTTLSLSNLVNLKYLSLESNEIEWISEDAFTHITKLIQLNLGKNFLKQIPTHALYTLSVLQRLDLSAQNQMLKEIDDYAFDRRSSSHHQLVKIDLSKNRISKIGSKAFCSRNLSYVNIQELDLSLNPLNFELKTWCVLRQTAIGIVYFR